MQTLNQIKAHIFDTIDKIALKSSDNATEKSVLRQDDGRVTLEMDSLDMTDLQMKLEEHYNLKIPDEEAMRWDTAGDVFEYVKKRVPYEGWIKD